MNNISFTISRRRVALILVAIALFLCLLSIALEIIEWELDTHSTLWFYKTVRLFSVNRESSVPTWYSVLLLSTCAVLITPVAIVKRREKAPYRWHWLGLLLLFAFLSLDESASIHEEFTMPFQDAETVTVLGITFKIAHYLYFGWVMVGIPFVVVMGLTFFRFWWRLPSPTRWQFLLAGAVYVGGAVVVESISAREWYLADGISTVKYSAIGTVEEFMEMSGAIIIIYALLGYLDNLLASITIHPGEKTTPDPQA